MNKILLSAISALLLNSTSQASSVITATGQGYWNGYGQYSNKNTNFIGNDFAGGVYTLYRDWFAFNIPAFGSIGAITRATINIYNPKNGLDISLSNTDTFNLYKATGTASFSDLTGNGTVLGSITNDVANTGGAHWVSINLNSDGIVALNASQGKQFIFGGSDTSTLWDADHYKFNGIFDDPGLTTPSPAAYLVVNAPLPPMLLPLVLSFLGMSFSGILGIRRSK